MASWLALFRLDDQIRDLASHTPIDERELDKCVSALSTLVLGRVSSSDHEALRLGSNRLKILHDDLHAIKGAEYAAGRLGTLCEVLGMAAMRTASLEFQTQIDKPANRQILQLLLTDSPISNQEISHRLGVSVETVCRKLRPLTDERIVVSVRRGRERLNTLSVAARGHLETLLTSIGEPIGEYDMARMVAKTRSRPRGVQQPLPRVSAVLPEGVSIQNALEW